MMAYIYYMGRNKKGLLISPITKLKDRAIVKVGDSSCSHPYLLGGLEKVNSSYWKVIFLSHSTHVLRYCCLKQAELPICGWAVYVYGWGR